MPTATRELSGLERLLRLFTEVRPGEGRVALLMFLNVFLILCAYYFIKPLREGWLSVSDVSGLSKMEVKAYSSFAQSLLLVFVIQWYSRLADRWPRGMLIRRSTLFCMSNMVLFWAAQPGLFVEKLPISGIVFYLWVGMFGVFVVAQFWALAADLYSDEQGKRLIPLVAIGATSGAVGGSWLAEAIVGAEFLGTQSLLLIAILPLVVSVAITSYVDRVGAEGERSDPEEASSGKLGSGTSGISIVLGSGFLLAIALMTLLLNWVNTNGENLLFGVLQDDLAKRAAALHLTDPDALLVFTRDETTAFYGNFFFWVNAIALLLQAFVASRLLKYGGFGPLLLMLPLIALLSYGTMALFPVLTVVALMKIPENATDYSINNTARHVVWLPVNAEAKFKGKPTVDALFARIGDGFAALTVLIGVQALALATRAFFAFNAALVLFWIVLALKVVRDHRRLSESAEAHAAH